MNSKSSGQTPRPPGSLSPTPLRDLVARQPAARRIGLAGLFGVLMLCGGQAPIPLSTPVPLTHQPLFALLAGALLGSRLGAASAAAYLLFCSATRWGWPAGSGAIPLTGAAAGALWALPLAAWLSGIVVERARMETPWAFALGAAAGWAALDAGTAIQALAFPETSALREGSAPVLSQLAVRLAHSATAALIAASGSLTLRAGEQE